MKSLVAVLCFLILPSYLIHTQAQNPKKFYKTAEDFIENQKYSDAIDLLNKAIEIDPDYADAYLLRAQAFERINDLPQAAEDYKRAAVFITRDTEVFYHAGRVLYDIGRYEDALEMLNQALNLKERNLAALQVKVLVLMELEDYYNALKVAEQTFELKLTAQNYYYHGLVSEKLKNFSGAERDFEKAIGKDKKYTPAYIALANRQLEGKNLADATENINKAIELEPNNIDAYIVRSAISKAKLDFPNAINDISKAILVDPKNPKLYFKRAQYYQDFTQHQNAINDFNQALLLDDTYAEAYYQRAQSYEKIASFKAAIKDYKKLATLVENDKEAKELLASAEERLLKLNRESVKPELQILSPRPINNQLLEVPINSNEIMISGRVLDESKIEFLKINNVEVPLEVTDDGAEFAYNIPVSDADRISVTTGDIYNNILQTSYAITRTEIEAPKIKLIAPYASDNNDITLENNGSNLYIEGKITDASKISSIFIEGVAASYQPESLNPGFSATIDIRNKNKISVKAVDQFGNEQLVVYNLKRNNSDGENPMGKTWAIFIENSNYSNFASLEGPTKDVTLMKGALANYRIDNLIHKIDMSKAEMERFFSIELRDLVRSNNVNSLLIWYAGHGKFINETGYWVPVDANRDDEFTYYNINALKAAMQGYSKYVTHTLIVTDACESGPTFYQAMRSTNESRSCDDWKATRFKSSQVLSSAGYELAVDNSQFTRTFANTLMSNPNACIPIDEIVQKVTKAVESNNQQKPKFGKIQGLEDENGTFFFITRD